MAYQLIKVTNEPDWKDYHAICRTELWEARGRTNYNDKHKDEYLPNNHSLLLKLDNHSIGRTRLDNFCNGTGAIRLVAILKDFQRQGHGRKLSSLVEEYAVGLEIKTLFVNAAPDATGYYEKLGWKYFTWDESELVGIGANSKQMMKPIQ